MRFCENCGAEVQEGAGFCTHCGASLKGRVQTPPCREAEERPCSPHGGREAYFRDYETYRDLQDTGSGGFGVLGFFLPIVGLILFLVWHDTYPRRARSAGMGALIAVGVAVTFGILSVLLAGGLLRLLI